jgi:N-acyl-D-amino-acid deacylase
MNIWRWLLVIVVSSLSSCSIMNDTQYDVVIRNGTIYDGSGNKPFTGDVAIQDDRIVGVGDFSKASAKQIVDAHGKAVTPGFINMLSWAGVRLIYDGRSQSDIRQGVTLEVIGEGESAGPLNDRMRQAVIAEQGDIKFPVEWTTLGDFLEWIKNRGISCNIASYVGAATIRAHEIGEVNRKPTPDEMDRMKALVAQAMEEGAMGVSSSLIYAPGVYASTEELTELCKVAAKYNGIYTSHLRSEGNAFLEAVDEFLTICRDSGIRGEIFHLKAAGKPNWPKLNDVIQRIENARREGLPITADMYLYTAGSTGLEAMFPPWVHDGGYTKWVERMKDPATRARLITEISTPSNEWENFYLASGSADKIILIGFKNDKLKPLTGKTLAQVATERGKSPIETAMDLVIEDGSRVEAVYFLMSEENVQKQVKLPWVAFCSDAGSFSAEGIFLKSSTHPRAYGNFARLLGKYVRDEKLIPMEDAIRRLTSFPAETLKIRERGWLKPGYFADVVVFDPATIQDHATFEKPHQYSTGVQHVFVNGTQVLKDGEHTGEKPGRIVRGPGWKKH